MKEKIGKMILSFFVIMICCTLVARGADSVTVAKVQTSKLKNGNLTHSFSGTGKLQAKNRRFQFLPENQKVAEILLRPGNAVEAGQALIQLDKDYLGQQISDKDREIQKMKLTIAQQKLNGQTAARLPATAQAELSLNAARETRNKARDAFFQAEDAYNNYINSAEYKDALSTPPAPTAPPSGGSGTASPSDAKGEGTGGEAGTGTSLDSQAARETEQKKQDAEQKKQELQQQMNAAREQMDAAQEAYDQTKGNYHLAEQEEQNARTNEARQAQSSSLTLQGLALDLEELEEDMEKLKAIQKAEGIVTAETSGTLESVGISQGNITTGTEALVLASPEQEACGEIPPEEIGNVSAGDKVEVRVTGSAKAVTLSIERLEAGEEGSLFWFAPFTGPGSLANGTAFAYDYSQKSAASYDQLIPLSALYESSGTTYVLVAEVRSGILGDSYTAVKVPVTLLEKDSLYAAVQTSLGRDALIITSSSKYVKEGDRVRLDD